MASARFFLCAGRAMQASPRPHCQPHLSGETCRQCMAMRPEQRLKHSMKPCPCNLHPASWACHPDHCISVTKPTSPHMYPASLWAWRRDIKASHPDTLCNSERLLHCSSCQASEVGMGSDLWRDSTPSSPSCMACRRIVGEGFRHHHLCGDESVLLRMVAGPKDIGKSLSEADPHLLHLNLTCMRHSNTS